MAISKIILNGVTQIDLTQDSVSANNLIAPNTAHGADGNQVTGTATGGISGAYMFPIEQNNEGIFVPTITDFSEVAAAQEEQHLILYAYNLAGAIFAYASYYENYEGYSECVTYGYTIYFSDYDTGGDSRNYGTASVYVTYGYYNGALKTDYTVYKEAYNTSGATATADKILSGYTAFGPNGIIDGTASGGSEPNLQAKTNISPTTSSQTITADSGYDGLSSVQINAMPTGTAGTPTATKGTVSNHSISVTPSVTNATGYITGGTKTGTAVTVSASELVSGSETKTANGTYDVTNLSEVVVNVPTSGSTKNVQYYMGADSVAAGSYTATDVTLTVSKTGTYKVSWMAWRSTSSGTSGSQLYINGTAYGSANTTFTGTYGQAITLTGVSLTQGDVLVVRARARGTQYYMYVGNLIIEEQ